MDLFYSSIPFIFIRGIKEIEPKLIDESSMARYTKPVRGFQLDHQDSISATAMHQDVIASPSAGSSQRRRKYPALISLSQEQFHLFAVRRF